MTRIANASRHALSFVPETEPGVTPDNPQMTRLRHTTCALALSRDSFVSEEKRQDRQIADVRTGTNQIAGAIGFEPSFGAFDTLLEGCLAGEWANDELKCGCLERSFTIERGFTDIGKYTRYKGCFLNRLSLSVKPNAMISGSFDVIGLDAENADQPLAAQPDSDGDFSPFDSYTGELKEGGEPIAVVTGIDLALDNGIQPQFVVFQRSAPFVSWGRSNVTGTLTAFFEDNSLIGKFLDETPTSLEFTLEGKNGGSYTFILPNIRYTGADNPMDADGPISINMPFQAILDDETGTNLIVRRKAATTPPAGGGDSGGDAGSGGENPPDDSNY